MNIKWDMWQEEVLNYVGFTLLCAGRRSGKTLVFCEKGVRRMHNKPNTSIKIASLTEEQAIMINFIMTQMAFNNYPEDIDYDKKPTLKTLTFKNGSNVLVRPVGQAGDAFRGFECDILYVDEASRMPKLFWEAVKPLILTKIGEIWMSSTPNGKKGYFWERFKEAYIDKDPEASFKVWYISTEDALLKRPISETWTQAQRDFAEKQLARERREMTTTQYGTEYLGLFMEDMTQFFSDELIDTVSTAHRQLLLEDNFMGCDIAAMGGDETTFEVIHKYDEEHYTHTESIAKKQITTKTEQDIIDYIKIYNVDKCGIDTGGLGLPIFQRLLLNDEVRSKVVSMSNRTASLNRDGNEKQKIFKEDMYENLKNMMEKGEIKILNDDKVRLSLKSIQKEVIENETTKEKKVIIYGNYSHIAEGLIRAAWLAKNEKVNKFRISYL